MFRQSIAALDRGKLNRVDVFHQLVELSAEPFVGRKIKIRLEHHGKRLVEFLLCGLQVSRTIVRHAGSIPFLDLFNQHASRIIRGRVLNSEGANHVR